VSDRLHPGDAVRIRGEQWVVHRQTIHGHVATLDVRGGERGNAGRTARFLLPFEPVERVIPVRAPKVVRPARWRVLARSALASATPRIDSLRTARASRFDVMPYQLEPALAVTGGLGCRMLIADDVGLGKTVQAGLIVAELLERQPDGHALVICPAGLRSQWQEELRSRFGLAATLLDANGLAQVAADFDAAANPWSACRLIITSIDFIKRPEVMRAVEGMVWDAVVLDEAHNLASRSDRATAAAALAWRARTLVLLSATPHSGDAAAFNRLCSLGDSGGRFPLVFFRRTRADTDMPANRRTRWLEVRPSAAEARMLTALVDYARSVWTVTATADAARLAMTVLLRRASSSPASLARSLERRLASLADSSWATPLEQLGLPFTDPSAGDDEPTLIVGAPGLPDVPEERTRLEHLISLARLAASQESKIAAIARWLSRVHEPVLVFTEYRDTLTHLHETLSQGGLSDEAVVELHGGMTRAERRAAEASFVKGPARVLLATDAASEGLNLHQRCRCVINLEIPWSPVRLEQRIGRVDRIGQARRVHALNLVAAGTHEITIVGRVQERQQRATKALSAAAMSDFATAALILTGAVETQEQSAVVFPAPTRRPDLADRTGREAEWITTARRIGTAHVDSMRRPFVAVLTRAPRRLLWVAEVSTCGEDDLPVWTTMVGMDVVVSGAARSDIRSMVRDVGDCADRMDVGLQRPIVEAIGALRESVSLSTVRERAICAGIRMRHARIAAELLQPGLFDRRAERRAAAQSSVFEEALAQCQSRIDDFARLAEPQAGPPVIRFAALL
jgi:superfamily II DNA or RNA helicase